MRRSCSLAVLRSFEKILILNVEIKLVLKWGSIKNFEELEIWKMSRVMVNLIYSDFKDCHDYGFKDQITRAGVSIMNNIGEGFCCNSHAEFSQYLKVSKGSSGEVKSMHYIAEDQAYVDSDVATERRDKLQCLINSISILMKYLKTSKKQ